MNEDIKWTAAALAVLGLAAGGYIYYSRSHKPAPVETPVVATKAPPPAVPDEPEIKHPLPESETPQRLPPLNDSDQSMRSALVDLYRSGLDTAGCVPKELIRHIVVSVDNLPEQKVAERMRPVRPAAGRLVTTGPEESPVLDPANYERYKPQVQLIRSIDSKRLVATYVRYYPLFQEAYESLGHPPKYFNDRLIEVIDQLLVTPDVRDPIPLARPNVQFEFADAKLESLAAGQKALIRMGPDNATAVKDKLRELRGELIAQRPAQ